jgi:hypothetical protein
MKIWHKIEAFVPMLLLVLVYMLLGGWNIYERYQEGLVLRTIDYLIPLMLPLAFLYIGFIASIIKLSTIKKG